MMSRVYRILYIAIALLVGASASGQSVLTITKTSYEAFNCSMDFSQATATIATDGITLVSVTSSIMPSGTDSSAEIIALSPTPGIVSGTQKILFRVQGGNNGEAHRLSVKVIDSVTGEQFEGVMLLEIKN